MKPVGLTRAEENALEEKHTERVVAPDGAARCRLSMPPNGDDCVAAATVLVSWKSPEDPKTAACIDCVKRLQQQCPGSIVGVESISQDRC